jgi:uncharacterized protein (TIGR02594 family)
MTKKEYTYEDKLQFIKTLYCPARQLADEAGCSWELLLAQAAEETGWGEKVLPGTNNIYNVKADASWSGESGVFNVPETDPVTGRTYWVNAPFRIYPSVLESLRDRQKFVESNHRYAAAGLFQDGIKGDPDKEINAIAKAHYATDKDYETKIKGVLHGPTMKRAVAKAQKEGCKGCLPTVNVYVLDAAKVHLANTKIEATQGSKTIDLLTDKNGQVQVQAALSGGPVSLQAWSEHDHKWVQIEQKVTPTTPATAITVIAPTIVVPSATELHQPPPAHAGASHPSAPAAPPAASDTASLPQSQRTGTQTYTVRKGDTLSKIAKKYSTSYRKLAHLNSIASPYFLYPQQVLIVPKPHAGGDSALAGAPVASAAAAASAAASAGASPSAAASTPVAAASGQAAHAASAAGTSGAGASAHADAHSGSGAAASSAAPKPTPAVHAIHSRNEDDQPKTEALSSHHAPWMAIAEQERHVGVKRRGGAVSTEHIREYFSATVYPNADPNSTAYCAAFVNWCLQRAGYEGTKGKYNARANSFLGWGRPTRGNKPAYGAIAVVHFGPNEDHVTFVNGAFRIEADGSVQNIATLGGNQGHAHEVNASHLPARLIVSYRFPIGYVESEDDYHLKTVHDDSTLMTAAGTR